MPPHLPGMIPIARRVAHIVTHHGVTTEDLPADGRYVSLEEATEEYAFLITRVHGRPALCFTATRTKPLHRRTYE